MSSKGLPLSEIVSGRILEGWHTNVFERSKVYAASEDCCLSIIGSSRSVDIECDTKAERDMLVKGLRNLVLHVMDSHEEHERRKEADRSRARSASSAAFPMPSGVEDEEEDSDSD